MKPLTLHVGLHKTGTTSIQSALAENRSALSAAGILYPDLSPPYKNSADAQHKIAKALLLPDRKTVEKLVQFRWKLFRDARKHNSVLLSTEAISRLYLGHWNRQKEDDWFGKHRRYLKRLKLFLADFDPEVLVYLRQPHSFAESLFKEHLSKADAKNIDSFESFVESQAHMFHIDRRMEALQAVFPKVEIRQFESEARAGLVTGFFKGLGLEPPEVEVMNRKSVSNRGALWLCMQTGPESVASRRARILYAVEDPDKLFAEEERSTLWGNTEQRQAFRDRYARAFELPVFDGLADLPSAPTTRWTPEQQETASTAFKDWANSNVARLELRERRKLAFHKQDPVVPKEEAPSA